MMPLAATKVRSVTTTACLSIWLWLLFAATPTQAADIHYQKASTNSYQKNLNHLRANHPEIQPPLNTEEPDIKERILLEKAAQPEASVQVPVVPAAPEIPSPQAPVERKPFSSQWKGIHLPKLFQREAKHSRPDPYEIIEAVRQRHRDSAEQSSMQGSIQTFKEQLPERFSYGEAAPTRQLKQKARQLPAKLSDSIQQPIAAGRNAFDKQLDKTGIRGVVQSVQNRIDSIKQIVKARAIALLEKTSRQADQTAERLKT